MKIGQLIMAVLVVSAAVPAIGEKYTDLTPQWQKNGKNVLHGFKNMYNSHVVHEPGEEYPFKIWFFGWSWEDCNPGFSGCDAIFFARGKSLDSWEVYSGDDKWDSSMTPSLWQPVLSADNKFYDSWHNGDPSVVKKDGVYYMAYSATGFDRDRIPSWESGDKDKDLYCVMGATSRDGVNWQRTSRPLLIHKPDIRTRGEGDLDVTLHGMYHRPSLMYDDGKWKLWFDYYTGRSIGMGYAEADGDPFKNPGEFRILQCGDNPALEDWPNPDVVKAGKKYYSYCDAGGFGSHQWIGRRICEAESDDGINWTITGNLPPEADTPATQIPEALVISEDGKDKIILFYACQIGGEPFDYRYNRIRYAWKYVEAVGK